MGEREYELFYEMQVPPPPPAAAPTAERARYSSHAFSL